MTADLTIRLAGAGLALALAACVAGAGAGPGAVSASPTAITAAPGLAGYSPDTTPADFATLVGQAPDCQRLLGEGPESLVFVEIDGIRTDKPLAQLVRSGPCLYPSQVRVAPGRHVVRVLHATYASGMPPASGGGGLAGDVAVIGLTAEPMAIYDVRRVVQGYDVRYEAVRRAR